MDEIISVEHVSMRFRLAAERVDNLKELLIRKLRWQNGGYSDFWALRDVSFSVKRGEAVALIGANGSGKSTMLKIISGILAPTRGRARVSGTIAPLIELGAGFDPDLTGRENVFLNGAILGHSKAFMREKYEEIVDFSELRDFIDVPIKNYSSGMVARLGFSVATIVDPEILIVDEILAVGDRAFQEKCRLRMERLMRGGTTVVLVSHSAADIRRVCQRAVWLDRGRLRFVGSAEEALARYAGDGAPEARAEAPAPAPEARPAIAVTRSSLPALEEYTEEIKDLWESRWLTNMGVKHQTLQRRLEAYLDTPHVELLTNGHMALELSLQALGLRGEVITTPFTFASTTHAILRSGLTPVFCDIDPEDFTIDVRKIEALITERTCAIVPVHVYGHVCRVEELARLAEKHRLKVVYDAAHAFGVRYRGRGVASYGDAACFSFHATKVYHTIEGGAVGFGDAAGRAGFGLQLYRLKNFGIRGPEHVDAVGANAKMNEFCAAMGLCNLRHIADELEARRRAAAAYREILSGVPGVQLGPEQADVVPNYAYFPVLFDRARFGAGRDEVAAHLAAWGVHARKYFYPLTTAYEAFHGAYDVRRTPVALRVSESVLTLPLYAALSPEEAGRIARFVLECGR